MTNYSLYIDIGVDDCLLERRMIFIQLGNLQGLSQQPKQHKASVDTYKRWIAKFAINSYSQPNFQNTND